MKEYDLFYIEYTYQTLKNCYRFVDTTENYKYIIEYYADIFNKGELIIRFQDDTFKKVQINRYDEQKYRVLMIRTISEAKSQRR